MGGKLEEFKTGGRALVGSLIGAGCGLSSISFYTHGAFVTPIAADTGWGRGDLQLGVTIMILMGIVTAPAVGVLIDRFGPRRVALTAMPLYGASLAALSLCGSNLWSYYAGWAAMSILAAGTLPTTWTRVVNAWFDRSRGTALGITLAGTGLAATFGPSYVTFLIDQFGWRQAYVGLGATLMLIAMPALWLLFRLPAAQATTARSRRANELPGIRVRDAILNYRFWAVGLALLFASAGISGLITNAVPLLIDRGLSGSEAARYAGLIGLSVIFGRLLVGVLVDRIWAPLIGAVFLSAPAISALVFAGPSPSTGGIVVSVVIIGLAAGAELDLLAFLTSRYFGLRYYGTLYGALYVFFSLGAGIAPLAFGLVFDRSGSYAPILTIAAGFSAAGALLMLTLGRYPREFSASE